MANSLTQSKPTKRTILNLMENQRKQNNISGNKFSFPIMHMHDTDGYATPSDPEFEFGNTTTTTAQLSPNSPADQLFSNGKLLPHSFPVFHPPIPGIYARSSSRTSSVSSRDSMRSSRSNSTNSSRNSTTSVSARSSVSTTDGSEIRRNQNKMTRNDLDLLHNHKYSINYRSSQSQRWQFIAPMPVLGRQGSVRRKEEVVTTTPLPTEKQKVGVGRRFLRSIVNACKECHAMP